MNYRYVIQSKKPVLTTVSAGFFDCIHCSILSVESEKNILYNISRKRQKKLKIIGN